MATRMDMEPAGKSAWPWIVLAIIVFAIIIWLASAAQQTPNTTTNDYVTQPGNPAGAPNGPIAPGAGTGGTSIGGSGDMNTQSTSNPKVTTSPNPKAPAGVNPNAPDAFGGQTGSGANGVSNSSGAGGGK